MGTGLEAEPRTRPERRALNDGWSTAVLCRWGGASTGPRAFGMWATRRERERVGTRKRGRGSGARRRPRPIRHAPWSPPSAWTALTGVTRW